MTLLFSSMTSIPPFSAGRLWHQPEFQAAVLNGALILIVPGIWLAYLDYTWDAVRPAPSTVFSSAIEALPIVMLMIPLALLVAWRSYVHGRAYRVTGSAAWRGSLESAAIAGGAALLMMLLATAQTWTRQPARLVAAYVAFYAGTAAVAGLVLGLVLTATAVVVIHFGNTRSRSMR